MIDCCQQMRVSQTSAIENPKQYIHFKRNLLGLSHRLIKIHYVIFMTCTRANYTNRILVVYSTDLFLGPSILVSNILFLAITQVPCEHSRHMVNFMCDLVWWQPNDIQDNPKRAVRDLGRTTKTRCCPDNKKLLQIWSLIVACHRNWRPATCLCIQLHQNRQRQMGRWQEKGRKRGQVVWADKWICYKLARHTTLSFFLFQSE